MDAHSVGVTYWRYRAALVFVAASSIVVAPFVWLGTPVGHDLQFHVASWMEVAQQWQEGILYPRWAAWANFGFGEPRFIFYPPISWMLGATLGLVLPWKMVPGSFAWVALIAAGTCMYLLARDYLMPHQALLAAVFYAANPSHLIHLYRRSAYAELLASAVFPLVVLFCIRLPSRGSRAVVPLALAFAAIWLTNAPAGVIVTYSVALVLATLTVIGRAPRILMLGTAAVVLGFFLSAFYVIPAVVERNWVNIPALTATWLDPDYNFLFLQKDTPLAQLNYKISALVLMEIVVILILAILSGKERHRRPEVWWTLVALGTLSIALMFSVSSVAYRYLPGLKYLQVPWRWMFVLNLALAALLGHAFARPRGRFLSWLFVASGLLPLLVVLAARADTYPGLVSETHSAIREGIGYLGTVEYAPRGSQRFLRWRNLPAVEVIGSTQLETTRTPHPAVGSGAVQVLRWGVETKRLAVDVSQPTVLALRLLNYPAWRVQVNRRLAQVQSRESSGELMVSVPAGHNDVEVSFARTADRTLGTAVSLGAGALVLLWLPAQRRCSSFGV